MLSAMRANTTQKAYDEAFLACSTAVYFEGQNNEKEALRSWRTALDHIYYHNSRRNPSTYRPASETERALLESLRQLELQCKERVDLLEALKKSRAESEESLALLSTDANAPTPPPPHGGPTCSQNTDAVNSWLGGGSVPPIEYSHLSRPPPLPYRPAMAPRKSSGTASTRENSLTQTKSASTLAPATAASKTSRTPSPEKKKGGMLRTLRPGRDGKPSSSKLPSSLRSRPEASKAATQAWSVKATSSSSRPSLSAPTPSSSTLTPSARSSLEKPVTERQISSSSYVEPQQPQAQAPFYSRTGESTLPTAYAASPPQDGSDSDPSRTLLADRSAPPIPRKSVDLSRYLNAQGSNSSFPSYRKEYPTPQPDARSLAASAAARSYNGNTNERSGIAWDPSTRRLVPKSSNTDPKLQNAQRQEPHEPISLETTDEEEVTRARPAAMKKGRARGNSVRAELPDLPATHDDAAEEEPEESDEWKRRTSEIMKNLPRGVDKQAAQQILNEIVIQGDEVHWDDVAGLEIAKSALKETVVYPFLRPDLFMGLREPARGMLLFGPPGTGKTMLARAVATESKSTFFAISASSLTSKFLGESEKLVRALFQLAKMLAPSIIFVDEIDSLLSSRGGGEHEATRRIKTEFLIQWSDLQKAAAGRDLSEKDKEKGDATRVLVLAATNLPWAIDEAARRRFVRRQYIPLPEDWVRKQQVKTLLSHQKHELSERDMDRLVRLTDGFSGSDITALAKDAAMGPLRSLGEKLLSMTMDQIRPIQYQDFVASLQTIRPSVSKQGLKEFEDWATQFGERGG